MIKNIVFVAFVALLGFAILCYFIYWYIKNKNIRLNQAQVIFNVDIKNKCVMLNKKNTPSSWFPFSDIKNYYFLVENWLPIPKLKSIFFSEKLCDQIFQAFYYVKNKKKLNFDYEVKILNTKYLFEFSFFISDDQNCIMKVAWKKVYVQSTNAILHKTSRQIKESLDIKKYSTIFAANFKKKLTEANLILIVENIKKCFLKVEIYFWQNQGILYWIISPKISILFKKPSKSIKCLLRSNIKKVESNYLKLINSIFYLENIWKLPLTKTLLNFERRVSFLLINDNEISVKTPKIKFINISKVPINKEKFIDFSRANSKFNSLIKSNKINTEIKKITNIKTKKSSGKYAFPTLQNILSKNDQNIVLNSWSKELMINSQIENVLIYKTTTLPNGTIIDVNYDWLINNQDLVFNKKLLYALHLPNSKITNSIITIIKKIKKKSNVKFGLIIYENLEINSKIIEPSIFSFLVIGESFIKTINRGMVFSKILLLNKIVSLQKIKILYMDSILKWDYNQKQTLNIKYVISSKDT